MKKAFLIIIISMVVYLSSFFVSKSFAFDDPNSCESNPNQECCCEVTNQFQRYCSDYSNSCGGGNTQGGDGGNTPGDGGNTPGEGTNTGPQCAPERVYSMGNGLTGCCPSDLTDGACNALLEDVGINISTDCLLNGQCNLNVYKVMGIRKSNENPTVLGFFQDITIASTTVMLGTVLVIAMIIGGLFRAFASITGKDTKKGKEILISSFIGMLLVLGSYAIIRVIQFLALGGS